MKKKILITCDTEALDFPLHNESPRINIFGDVSGDCKSMGIHKIINIVDKVNKKVLFFYDICTEYSYPGISKEVRDVIIGGGHDLEMHAHIEHITEDRWALLGYKKPSFAINYFNDEAAKVFLEPLVELFTQEIGYHPSAFRAGAWRYSSGIINALNELNIPFSFNYYPETTLRESFPHGVDAGPQKIFKWGNGVIEVPTGLITGPNIFSSSAKYYGFESHRLRSWKNYYDYIKASIDKLPEIETLVLVMHSWSFLNRKDPKNIFLDQDLLDAFEEFVTNKSELYEIISFDQLKGQINPGGLRQVPVEFSGFGNSKLLPL